MQSPLMMSGWPTTIGIGGPLPIVSLVVQSSFQKTAAHPPSSSIVSCNFRYIESSDGSVGRTAATVSKKCREEVSLSLALFDLYTLHSRLGIIYLGRAAAMALSDVFRAIFSKFLFNFSSSLVR